VAGNLWRRAAWTILFAVALIVLTLEALFPEL